MDFCLGYYVLVYVYVGIVKYRDWHGSGAIIGRAKLLAPAVRFPVSLL